MNRSFNLFMRLFKGFMISFGLAAILLVSSCEIGLGESVDTLPPEVSITGPSTNSILRDKFVISGECSDDSGVKEVTVELKNTELGKTYQAISVTPENNKWSVTLNDAAGTGSFPYADGKYDITVHAYDLAGKDSGPRSIAIVIDNTPPLMVLTRPSSGDKYGQKFDITGQAADDSNIDLIEVFVYSKDTEELLQTIQLKNVPPTIDLSAAVFGDEAYTKIYGTDKFADDKEYYCEIKAYDAARKYPEEAGDKGNETSFFYMYDDIYDLMSDYKLTELYHIQNGLYSRSVSTDSALATLKIPAGTEGSIQTKRNAFVLNPLNNPTFELSGYKTLESFEALENNNDYKIKNEGKITVKVNVGRDSTPLVENTIEVYAKRVTGKTDAGWVYASDDPENPASVKLFPAAENIIVTNGSNREITIDMSQAYGLVFGSTYILDVKGQDKDNNDIFNNGTDYGFYYKSSDKAPSLKITSPSTNTVYMNASGTIELTGTTFHEESKPKVYVQFTKEGEETVLKEVELNVSEKANEKNTYVFTKTFAPADFIDSVELGNSETYTMNVYAAVGENTASPSAFNIRYDVGTPNVTVSSVLPLADTSALAGGKEYNVNGKISIKVSFNDDETSIKKAGYKYTDKNNQLVQELIAKTSGSTIVIDTNELTDKADLDLKFFAEDQAGNTVEYPLVYDDANEATENPKYFVDQDTDKPLIVIEESQLKKVGTYSDENISILSRMASVTGTISDDDGLESYSIKLYTVDSDTGVVDSDAVSETTADNMNGVYTKQFTLQMPNENNFYKLVVSATDKKKMEGETAVTNEWVSFVKVAGGAPSVSITSGNKGVASSTGQKKTLTLGGKFSGAHTPGENVSKHLKLYLLENTAEAKNDSTKWVQILDAASVNYGTDALTKEWSTPVSVNNLPVKTEGEHTVLIRVVDGNGNASDDTLTYSIDDTKPSAPNVSQIDEKIVSSSYQFKTTSSDDEQGSGLAGLFYQISKAEKTALTAADLTAVNGWTEVSGNGSFNFYQTFVAAETTDVNIPAGQLKEDSYTLYMYAVDNAGNISARAAKSIVADFTLPVIGETNYTGMPENDKLLADGSIFVRKPTAAEKAADSSLTDEYFTISGSVTDTLKLADVVLSAKLGETEHLIHLLDKKNASGETSSLDCTVTKSADDKEWTWSIKLPFAGFADGSWVFNYKAYDQSGRYSEQNTTMIIDTTPPNLHFKWNRSSSTENWIKENNVTVSEMTTGEGISENSKDKVSYYQTSSEMSLDNLKALSEQQWTGFSGASRTISLDEGWNYVYIRSVDEAGNISYSNNVAGSASFVCRVDRTRPTLNIAKPNSGEMIGIQEATVIEVSVEEDGSGINAEHTYVKVFKDDGTTQVGGKFSLAEPESGSTNRKATIPASTWNGITDTQVKIVAYVKDNAGNENDTSAKIHTLTFDRELPDIKISNPVASTVNGIIRVNGTSSDNGGMLRNVILYRTPIGSETGTDVTISTSASVAAADKTKKLVLLDANYSTFESADANVWEVSYDKESVKTNGFKTNDFSDGTAFTIYAVATDQSGNINYASKAITVDQDSDRPVIKITNFSVKSGDAWSTTEATALWHKDNKIRGTVSDDDGIEYLKVATYDYENSKWNDFSDNLYSNGSWETSELPDGKLGLKFEVKDTDGKVFTSVTSPADAAALQATPKIQDAANTLALKGSTGNAANSILYAKVDTTLPVISEIKYSTNGTDFVSAADLNNKAFGGPGSKAYIRFTATDDNGISSAKVYLKGTKNGAETISQTAPASNGGSGNVYTAELTTSTTPADLSNFKFVIEVIDGSTASNSETYNIRLDNEGPTLAVSYTKEKYYGSISNQLVGTSSDAANTTVADVYFKITEKKAALTDDEIAASDWEIITDKTDSIHKYTSALAWIINFTTSNQRTNGEYSASPLNDYLDSIFTPDAVEAADKASNMETVRNVTIWYYGVDQLGNKGAIAHTDLIVDPSGDRPIVTVDFPTNDNDSTGGSVRLNGGAQTPSAEVGVSTVWIQIDPTYDSAFASAWESELTGIINGREEILGYQVEDAYYYDKSGDKKTAGITFKDGSGNTVDAKGILADMTSTTWSKYINKMDEFADAGGTVSTMAIRVYAISPTGKVSAPLTRIFKIDPDAPQITNLQLVQYADNTNKTGAKTVKAYTDDMWISGEWWLEADISDDDLGSVTYKNAASVESALDISGKTIVSGKQVYKFSQKVGSSEFDKYGTLSYTINAQEAGGQKKSSQKVIRLNYDNKKPDFTLTNVLDDADNTTNKIINSNGSFTPQGSASDTGAQSGIDKVITYYTRTKTSGENTVLKAVDPLAAKSGTAFANEYDVTSESGTGIPLVTGKAASSVSNNSYQIKVATANVPGFVRKGGLVRISNVYYVIQKVETSGDDKLFTMDKSVPAGFSTVDFAVAQVVEEGHVESSDADADADGLIEKLQNNAGTYSWMAAFDSTNIQDGSITAGYLVYDNAGNYELISKATKVINNAPRIAGFRYGTDDNGDGSVSGTELKNNLTGLNASQNGLASGAVVYRGTSFPVQGSETSPLFTIKGLTEIYPEIVGGNGNLAYGYTVAPKGEDNFGTASRTVTGESFATNTNLVTYDTIVGNKEISIGLTDFLNGDDNGTIGDGVNKFTFTISDSTATGGAQSASFSFFANVVVQDTEVAVAKIRPFFWKRTGKPDSAVTKISEYYNSIYDGDLTQGHIELEADWKLSDGYSNSATTGVYDADPKVSGKIVLRGKAHDNVLLEGLWFKIDGFSFTGVTAVTADGATKGYSKLASYTPGTGWSSKKSESNFTASTPSNFYIKVLNETIDQTGHTVDWELGINTAAVENVAATDVVVYVMATDRGKLSLKQGGGTQYVSNMTAPTSTTQPLDEAADENWNASGKWSPYYRMDIVPYITSVSTALGTNTDAIYARTSLGHYSVNSAETGIKIYGFNLGTNSIKPTVKDSETTQNSATVGTLPDDFSYIPVTSISSLKSGKLNIAVNNIPAINNLNSNDSKGSYVLTETIGATGNYSIYSNYYYNRKPNNINNNLLTDDVYFDVWGIDGEAVKPISGAIEQPVMDINPVNGNLGFAFVNGPMYFSMGGKVKGTYHSAKYWLGGIDFWTSTGFRYDALGHSYGLVAGGDINGAGAMDQFRLMTDRWGLSSLESGGYNGSVNQARMEMVGQYDYDSEGTGYFNVDKKRIKSPSIATWINGSNTVTYIAYYDALNEEIRFRWGNVTVDNSNEENPSEVTSANKNNGLIRDYYGRYPEKGNYTSDLKTKITQPYTLAYCSLVAGKTKDKVTLKSGYNANNGDAPTGTKETVSKVVTDNSGKELSYYAGQYLDLDCTTTGTAVLVWYDDTNNKLVYTYNTAPTTNIQAGEYKYTDTGWADPVEVFGVSGIGEYCKVRVDGNGGVHIAALDAKNYSVYYAYKSSIDSGLFETCAVDTYATVGTYLHLDVALNNSTDKKAVPYISYYSNTCVRPVIATKVDLTSNAPNGAENKLATQKWEVSIIPTEAKVSQDYINVGVWKDSGVLKNSSSDAAVHSHSGAAFSATCEDTVYGNGTKNPILGYATKVGSNGFIETAQMK